MDASERFFRDEMLCASREEHIVLFGDDNGWEEDDIWDDAMEDEDW